MDAEGGTPDGDFAEESGIGVAARRCPYRLDAFLACGVSYLVCEVGNELGPFRQVPAPHGMILKDWRDGG